jgi:transcriptional regulator with XRE-family HTH domain
MKSVGNALTLRWLRVNLGWTMMQLAKKAGVSYGTISRAEHGGKISVPNAKKIADALSKGYNRPIQVSDIEDLNIQ